MKKIVYYAGVVRTMFNSKKTTPNIKIEQNFMLHLSSYAIKKVRIIGSKFNKINTIIFYLVTVLLIRNVPRLLCELLKSTIRRN